jgi:hypothetical protein
MLSKLLILLDVFHPKKSEITDKKQLSNKGKINCSI